jgi:hypothetical protein
MNCQPDPSTGSQSPHITSFSDCGLRCQAPIVLLIFSIFLVSNMAPPYPSLRRADNAKVDGLASHIKLRNVPAWILLLFEVGLNHLMMGCESLSAAIFMAHSAQRKAGVPDVIRSHLNHVPQGHRPPAGGTLSSVEILSLSR